MPRKLDTLNAIDDAGLILIVRLNDPTEVYNVATHAIKGGIRILEITLSTRGALDVIARLAEENTSDGVQIGAGTVLDGYSAYASINAGATFLVSPQLNPEMLKVANRYQIASISGALTPTEMVETVEGGADIVKLFPTDAGPSYAKAVLAPLAHIPVIPAGGVTPQNAAEWFQAGVAGVAVGSYITKAAAESKNYDDVAAAATTFIEAVREARPRA